MSFREEEDSNDELEQGRMQPLHEDENDEEFDMQYNRPKHNQDDDFEYNMEEDESDDEIYSISSDDEKEVTTQTKTPLSGRFSDLQIIGRKQTPSSSPETRVPVSSSPTPQQDSSRPSSQESEKKSPPNTKSRATFITTTNPMKLYDSMSEVIEPPPPKFSFNTRKYEDENDIKSLTSSRNESDIISVIGDDSRKSTFDYLKQKQEQLFKLNQQINIETKQVLKETDNIVKQQSKKIEEIGVKPNLNRVNSTVGNHSRSVTPSQNRYNVVATPSSTSKQRPASASIAAKKKVQENIDELEQYEDDDLDRAANEMGLEAAMKFYKARVKSLQKDVLEYSNQLKLKDDKIKELDVKYNAALIESKKISKNQAQFQSRLDRQRKEFDALQLKFKKQASLINDMQKENEKLKLNMKVDPSSHTNPSSSESPNSENRIKDIKYTRALEEIEKYKSQIAELQKSQREENDKQRKEAEALRKENKRLDRQKQDIVLAFKKQMKLIDILKRQIIHLEASKQLSFTEEEFTSLMNQ
ncbi:hypothetical protein FDP41_003906 [Naegleria fowleri]|uniref:Uncharacterized protein n=1 Tax=Naegleria fowleri TaxID=5763 RepID=A0A6A5BH83_NAEFO|nr:uncharacterized protein FDP41_003906 [Naegleria fowleri]KAF0977253.1 hypothetical protein FDP41_003906 [Naegleria fowleri]CAG4715829.1 unnamed protein product [Naegleria fowleri]